MPIVGSCSDGRTRRVLPSCRKLGRQEGAGVTLKPDAVAIRREGFHARRPAYSRGPRTGSQKEFSMAFDVNKAWSEKVSDPAFLAKVVPGWRKEAGLSQREAAEHLFMPVRTLQGIEQGRGFRYPELLVIAMIHIDHSLAEAEPPDQRASASFPGEGRSGCRE